MKTFAKRENHRMIKLLFLISVCLFLASFAMAQEVNVTLGPDEIGLNEIFTIQVTIENERLRSYEGFPEIQGFLKRGVSSGSSTQIINGKVTYSQSITQNYVPKAEGSYRIPDFTMTVNDEKIRVQGKMVKVGPARQQRGFDPMARDPFDRFFNRSREPQEFVDIEDKAFLALTTDKDEVYIGEGTNAILALYVAEDNRAPIDFYQPGQQIGDILKKLKPENAWEENFNIEKIIPEPIQVNGKNYTRYTLYQGTFFPITTEDLVFESVGLKMIKYKVAKEPSFFGRNRKEDFKTYYTKRKAVIVKELPPHPLRDEVAVGDYELVERISNPSGQTGESFSYQFEIRGEGNISAIESPVPQDSLNFEIYSPNIQQNIRRNSGKVYGSKEFTYFAIPQEPGEYDLGKLFNWIYFDPNREVYDTLRSEIKMQVTGESQRNRAISANNLGGFYDRIAATNNKLQAANYGDRLQIFANLAILCMLVVSAFFIFKK